MEVGQLGSDEVRNPVIWDLVIVLYDGQYVDQKYIELSGTYNISNFDFNAQNA